MWLKTADARIPAAGAEILWFRDVDGAAEDDEPDDAIAKTVTGPDGAFAVDLPMDEPVHFGARHEFGVLTTGIVEPGREDVHIEMTPAGAIRIHVLGAAGAECLAEATPEEGKPGLGNIRTRGALTSDARRVTNYSWRPVEDDGTFEFEGVADGQWLVHATRSRKRRRVGERPSWSRQIVEVRGRNVDGVEIRLGGDRPWGGRIVGSGDARLVGHVVDAVGIRSLRYSMGSVVDRVGKTDLTIGSGPFRLGIHMHRPYGGLRWLGVVGGDENAVVPDGTLLLHSERGFPSDLRGLDLVYLRGQLPEELMPIEGSSGNSGGDRRTWNIDGRLPGRYRARILWADGHSDDFAFSIARGATELRGWSF